MTRLVFIRHGESQSNANGWISGQASCGGLTEMGQAQAEALRDRLAASGEAHPDVVFASTMRRAVETAAILTSANGHLVEQVPDLIERTSGEAEGMTLDEYEQAYGRPAWSDWSQPLSPGGESNAEFADRVRRVRSWLVDRVDGGTAWVVCHGGVIMSTAMQSVGLTFDAAGIDELQLAPPVNTSISEWTVAPGSDVWQLRRYNDVAHLEGLDLVDGDPAAG